MKQVFILAVIELIEDCLTVLSLFPSFADVLETVSIEIECDVDIFLRFMWRIAQEQLCDRLRRRQSSQAFEYFPGVPG